MEDFEIPKEYITYEPALKRQICVNVILEIFQKIDLTDVMEEKIFFTEVVIDKMEAMSVEDEQYESAALFSDIKKVLQEFKINTQNNPKN